MLKRILLTSMFCLLTAGIGFCYFFFTGRYVAERSRSEKCTAIDIIVEDSLENKLISCYDVMDMLNDSIIGTDLAKLNIYSIEEALRSHGEIRGAEVFDDMSGILTVRLQQRKAVIRFAEAGTSFFSDSTGYMFPICNAANVPVVTGNIPVSYSDGQKGYCTSREEAEWMAGIIALGRYIESHDYWHRQIEQIDIAENGDIMLYTRDARQNVIFGDCRDIAAKFSKLAAFYKGIAPLKEAENYSVVNLKYKDQIICR